MFEGRRVKGKKRRERERNRTLVQIPCFSSGAPLPYMKAAHHTWTDRGDPGKLASDSELEP